MSNTSAPNVCVSLPPDIQAVVLFLGNHRVLIVHDDGPLPTDVRLTPVQRAVTVARLRAVADDLEAGGGS